MEASLDMIPEGRPFKEAYACERWRVGQDWDIPLMTAGNIHSCYESVFNVNQ